MKTLNRYKSVSSIGLGWLFCSGLFLTKVLPVSPVHIMFCIAIFFVFLGVLKKETFGVGRSSVLYASLGIYFFTLLVSTGPAPILNLIITFTCPLLVYSFFYKKEIKKKWFNYYFLFYGLLFIGDGVWRILNPADMNLDRLAELGIGFQIYKLNTIMYMDSNFVGLQSIAILSFFCWLSAIGVKLSKVAFILLFVGTFLTFSRAAIILSLVLMATTYLYKAKIPSLILNIVIGLFFLATVLIVFDKFSTDVSFTSKFHIIDATISYVENYSISTVILGAGIGNAKDYLGIGAHNLLITFFVETGLVGLILFISIIIYWCSVLGKSWLILIFPFLVTSMSLGTTAIPYLFTIATIAVLLKRQKLLFLESEGGGGE